MRRSLCREGLELAGLRAAAIFEAFKGTVMLLAGLWLLSLLNKDVQAVAESIIAHLHLDPISHYPRVFLEMAGKISDGNLLGVAVGAFAYAVLRWFEAFGLWHCRGWAEWLGVISGGLFLPLEIFELTHGVTALRLAIFVLNLSVVLGLVYVIRHPLAAR
ncbi:MAG: hypothetical protein JWM16_3237 [Verrucomicrobiales bacterium]|nr:hypothetical protein [Verrucomicrobiales bacterium]